MSGPPLPAGPPMDETNPELLLAEAFVEETDAPLFLTGRAGTGGCRPRAHCSLPSPWWIRGSRGAIRVTIS